VIPQYLQKKEASVLRDDLHNLFRQLIELYKKKLYLLKEISSNESQLRFYLQSDKISEISDLIQSDGDLFSRIDSIEFDIQSVTGIICKISGIEKTDFYNYFYSKTDEPIAEFKQLKWETNQYIADLIKERDSLIINMEKNLLNLKADIDTLNQVRNLNLKKIH
jgi:hypothetical protein